MLRTIYEPTPTKHIERLPPEKQGRRLATEDLLAGAVSGCLRPTRVDDLYLLCGIAPPHIRTVAEQRERLKRDRPTPFEPLSGSAESQRVAMWSHHLQQAQHRVTIIPKEFLPPGAEEAWPAWACLNRLRTGTGRCRTLLKKWGLVPGGQTAYDCGQEQAMTHLLICPLLPETCTKEDLEVLTPRGKAFSQYPTLEAPARLVQLSSNEEADSAIIAQEAVTIAQDITTVLCKLTGELSMACYKSLENTRQFLADNMDLHHVLKRLEQDNQLSPVDVQYFKEKPASLIDWLEDSKRQDLYDFLGCILKEAGQDFLVEEIEDSERNEEEAIGDVDQPVQAEQAGQIGTELPENDDDPGKRFKLEVPTAAMQKVVLLGEAGAGKSNLVLAITKGEAQVEPRVKETTGVDLTSYHDTKHGVMYELYDFGGDEIYHTTHQFLFTPQTLYLLNVDLHDYNSGKFQKSLGTWLTSVTSRVVNPSITVVGTKVDLLPKQDMKESLCHQIKKDIEAAENAILYNFRKEILSCEDALKALESESDSDVSEHFYGLTKEDIIEKKMSIEKIIEQRSRNLVYFKVLPVSSKTFEGVEDLCTRMAEVTFNLQAVEQRFKHSWISFKEAIRRGKESCLHMKACQRIGSAAGMTESDILNALSYLHMAGQILFYNHIRGMEDIIFPNPAIVLGLFKQIFGKDKKEHLHKYSLGMTERKANSHLKVLLEDKTAIFNKLLPLLKHFGLYHSGLFTPVLPTAKPEEQLQSDPGKLQPGYGSISIDMEYLQNAPVGFHEAIVSRLLSIPQTKYDLLRKDAGRLYHCQTVANFKDSKTYQWKIQTLHMHTFGARIEQVEMSYSCTPKVDRIQVCGKLRSAFGLVKEISEAVMQVCQDLFPMLYMNGTIKCEGAFNSVTLEATRRHRATELMRLSQGQSLENIKHDAHKHYLASRTARLPSSCAPWRNASELHPLLWHVRVHKPVQHGVKHSLTNRAPGGCRPEVEVSRAVAKVAVRTLFEFSADKSVDDQGI
ncbi:hypothetical protein Bbelb_289910 [Branchiostoma belcheri]|nr:hypothetical protein Bbelb_289910 [Branchiostoma belcheri]